jgi:acetoin utilization deacetylase AcuC-like enzyme
VSDLFREHDPGLHPERPARFDAVMQAVRGANVEVEEARAAAQEDLDRVHPPEFLAAIRELCEAGGGAIDVDTVVSERSYDAAVAASGAAAAAVDAVLAGDLGSAFCLGRPPGHHAEPARAMGFCLVNHAAVAAAHARAAGVERVAVLDWDAHHGNGTQAVFWNDPAVLYVSLHQYPFYPGTGSRSERGGGAGEGATVNIPLAAGTSEREFIDAFESEALPAVRSFDPGLLIVSAGFDAHRDDPLCDLGLSSAAFGDLTRAVRGIGPGPVLILEGGYDLNALFESVTEVLAALQ